MGHNGHATSSQDLTIVPCAACGLPANLNSGHVVVEFKKGETPQDTVCRVWHRRCYDEFVNRGEES